VKKKYLKNFENFKIDFLIQKVFFFKNKIFQENLPEARGFRELNHTQYEFEWFGQFISIS
jgi:hypothetical protein